MKYLRSLRLSILSLIALGGVYASAQEVVLPKPESPFQGKIGRTVKDSTPDFPKGLEAPAGAPNVLLIMTDDVGFGASSTFGGPIETPNFQRIADAGLRYNMFHTTALCSPTRAAPAAAALHRRDCRAEGARGRGRLEYARSRTCLARLHGRQPLAQSRRNFPGTRGNRRVPDAQVAARARLPPHQGGVGVPRQPHRRAAATGSAAMATRTGSSTIRV